jgi:PBP1b-binding outer membrane lipoprotein LpoB
LGHRSWQQSAALAVALLLGACAPAPVQEMSEARQAIEAARAAGAQQLARPQFEEANELLHSAQQLLNDRRFRDARRSASQARDVAIQARETAEAVSEE